MAKMKLGLSRGTYIVLFSLILAAGSAGIGRMSVILWQGGIIADATNSDGAIPGPELAESVLYLALALVGAIGVFVVAFRVDKQSSWAGQRRQS